MRWLIFYTIPAALIFSGCATSKILLESNPVGASIYKSETLPGAWQRVPDSYSTTPVVLNLYGSDKDLFLKARKYGFGDSEVTPIFKLMGLEKFTFSLSPLMRDNVYDLFYEKSILQANIPENDRKNIAIMEFSVSPSSIGSDIATMLAELFQDILVKAKAFNVIERRRIETVLKEQKLQQSGITDIEKAASLGKILNAQEILLGAIRGLDNKKIVSLSIIDVESSKIIYSDTGQYQTEKDIKDLVLELVNRLTIRFKTGSTK